MSYSIPPYAPPPSPRSDDEKDFELSERSQSYETEFPALIAYSNRCPSLDTQWNAERTTKLIQKWKDEEAEANQAAPIHSLSFSAVRRSQESSSASTSEASDESDEEEVQSTVFAPPPPSDEFLQALKISEIAHRYPDYHWKTEDNDVRIITHRKFDKRS